MNDHQHIDTRPLLINAVAELQIELPSANDARIVLSALEPETEAVASERATTTITQEENVLHLRVGAEDLTALRASMNSFLAWISACQRTVEGTSKRE